MLLHASVAKLVPRRRNPCTRGFHLRSWVEPVSPAPPDRARSTSASEGSGAAVLRRGLDTAGIGALAALLLLTVTWTWWAIKQGAYFGVVLYPGLVLLCSGLMALLRAAPWRANLRLSRPATLNPLSEEPLMAEGAIARESGDPERAIPP